MLQQLMFCIALLMVTGFTRSAWTKRAQRKAEDQYGEHQGCAPIRTVFGGRWPLGVDLVKGLWKANSSEHLLEFLHPFIEGLGPNLELRILGNVGLVTTDPENVKAVLSYSKTHKGEMDFVYGERREALMPLFGEGLFTQDGLPWKRSREMLRKQFARIQYNNLDIFTEHVETLIERLRGAEHSVVDLHPLFLNFTLDTTTSLLFGESAQSLKADSRDDFGKSLNDASWISAIRVQLAYLYWLCSPPQYFRACKKVKAYADTWVRKALDQNEKPGIEKDRYVFIQSLYDDLKDRELVRDQLVNVLLAGRDTTAGLLSWTFRLLIRHEKIFAHLKDEFAYVLGGDVDITKQKLQQMPYLKNVLTETLRLYPLVPVNFREANHPTVLPRGGGPNGESPILVRAKEGIGYAPYFMHRRKDIFGEDALSFRPDRWADGTLQEKAGWAYLPFNGGPRICLGQEFALLEASYVIIRVIQSFPHLALPNDEEVVPIGLEKQRITLTMSPADGCRVQL